MAARSSRALETATLSVWAQGCSLSLKGGSGKVSTRPGIYTSCTASLRQLQGKRWGNVPVSSPPVLWSPDKGTHWPDPTRGQENPSPWSKQASPLGQIAGCRAGGANVPTIKSIWGTYKQKRKKIPIKKSTAGTSLAVQWLRAGLPKQKVQVWVGAKIPHILQPKNKQKKKTQNIK